jgi:phage terminase large subunit
LIPLDILEQEKARRECKPNEFTGVTPLLRKINGKYRRIVPKLEKLFTIAGIMDDVDDQTDGFDFFPLEGGRAGAKSDSVAHLFCEIAEVESEVCICTREVQNSITESVYAYIKSWVIDLGYEGHYKFLQDRIVNTNSGFTFIFKGMQSGTRKDSIKSIKNAKYVWCEEAQSLSHDSIKMLLPTVRVEGRKLIFSYNRKTEKDPIVSLRKYSKTMLIIINYFDNPFLPKNLWDQAIEDKSLDEEEYLHVWEGHPLKDDPTRVIVPYSWLEKCLNLHKEIGYEPVGKTYAGVDVAEGETTKHDKNSIAIRQGPVSKYWKIWQCKNIYESVGVVKSEYYDWGFEDVYFDGIGVGVGYASEVARIDNVEDVKLPFNNIPFKGSNSVYGPDTVYTRHGSKIITNKDFFKNAKTQQWWNLRLMAQNSLKLLDGKKLDRDDYFLSFEGDLDFWRPVWLEICQATFKEDGSGRKMVDKVPGSRLSIDTNGSKQTVESPNVGDAVGYSYSKYFENGLRAHGEDVTKSNDKPFVMPQMRL